MKDAKDFYIGRINPDSIEFKEKPIHMAIIKLMEDYANYKLGQQTELRKHLLSFAFEHVFEDTKAIETMVDDYLTEQAHKLNY